MIKERAAPEVIEKARSGEVKIDVAAQIASLPKEEQYPARDFGGATDLACDARKNGLITLVIFPVSTNFTLGCRARRPSRCTPLAGL
jgi:hypothetical protein